MPVLSPKILEIVVRVSIRQGSQVAWTKRRGVEVARSGQDLVDLGPGEVEGFEFAGVRVSHRPLPVVHGNPDMHNGRCQEGM